MYLIWEYKDTVVMGWFGGWQLHEKLYKNIQITFYVIHQADKEL